MTTPVWQPGYLYQPGALVQPLSAPASLPLPLENGDLEDGATGWTFSDASIQIVASGLAFQGSNIISWLPSLYGDHSFVNDRIVEVTPGQQIKLQCRHYRGTNNAGRQGCAIGIQWLDSGYNVVGQSLGAPLVAAGSGIWLLMEHTATAPADAVFAQAHVEGYNQNDGGTHGMLWDVFTWDYTTPEAPTGLVFRAVQSTAGYSGSSEPSWPSTVGLQVVDNEVTWEAVVASRVVWEATPILVSGATEPDFPEAPGATVADNTIAWTTLDARVKDEKCPNSKIVVIAASKIFAADDDIIGFSATVNPLDWSTEQDAGYLPFGLQSYGATPCTAMGLYRGNLVAFNSEGYQMWQVDEDPANMALLDASPLDCPYPKSVQPVSNDLVLLTSLGVRNIGIAGASTNLQAGFFGKQIDPLVLAAIRALVLDDEPMALFWPGAGQYWLFFGVEAFVLTMNGGPKDMSWSRYEFPAEITDWAILGTELYLRTDTGLVWRVSEEALQDDMFDNSEAGGDDLDFEGYIAWPYLDFGQIGVEKQMEGFDLVCTGDVRVSFGYNQKIEAQATEEYTIEGDTLPGTLVPMPITGPSFQMRLTFLANQAWEWMAANLHLSNRRRQ